MHILSIQSWVAYGHVGNASAVFPLQRLGAEVSAINTVEFSNHPGYGGHAGAVCSPASIRALIEGVVAQGVLATCDALLSGYLGDPGTGEVILHAAGVLKAANPRALWCCDPVIGDTQSGIYVRPGIADFFRDRAVPAADILTPNQFELECLTLVPCASLEDVRRAVSLLQARMTPGGPAIVLVTSLATDDMPKDQIGCLVAARGRFHRLCVPRLPIDPKGAGDAMAALFLFHLLAGDAPHLAMEKAASALHGVLTATWQAGSREMKMVAAQAELACPSNRFTSESC